MDCTGPQADGHAVPCCSEANGEWEKTSLHRLFSSGFSSDNNYRGAPEASSSTGFVLSSPPWSSLTEGPCAAARSSDARCFEGALSSSFFLRWKDTGRKSRARKFSVSSMLLPLPPHPSATSLPGPVEDLKRRDASGHRRERRVKLSLARLARGVCLLSRQLDFLDFTRATTFETLVQLLAQTLLKLQPGQSKKEYVNLCCRSSVLHQGYGLLRAGGRRVAACCRCRAGHACVRGTGQTGKLKRGEDCNREPCSDFCWTLPPPPLIISGLLSAPFPLQPRGVGDSDAAGFLGGAFGSFFGLSESAGSSRIRSPLTQQLMLRCTYSLDLEGEDSNFFRSRASCSCSCHQASFSGTRAPSLYVPPVRPVQNQSASDRKESAQEQGQQNFPEGRLPKDGDCRARQVNESAACPAGARWQCASSFPSRCTPIRRLFGVGEYVVVEAVRVSSDFASSAAHSVSSFSRRLHARQDTSCVTPVALTRSSAAVLLSALSLATAELQRQQEQLERDKMKRSLSGLSSFPDRRSSGDPVETTGNVIRQAARTSICQSATEGAEGDVFFTWQLPIFSAVNSEQDLFLGSFVSSHWSDMGRLGSCCSTRAKITSALRGGEVFDHEGGARGPELVAPPAVFQRGGSAAGELLSPMTVPAKSEGLKRRGKVGTPTSTVSSALGGEGRFCGDIRALRFEFSACNVTRRDNQAVGLTGFFNYLACALGLGTPPALLAASDLKRQERLLRTLQRRTRVSLRFTHFIAELPKLRSIPCSLSPRHLFSSSTCMADAASTRRDPVEPPGALRGPRVTGRGDRSPSGATVWEAGLTDFWQSAGVDLNPTLLHLDAGATNRSEVRGLARRGVDECRLTSSSEAESGGDERSGSEDAGSSFRTYKKADASLIFLLSCDSPDPYSSLHFCRFMPFSPMLAYRSTATSGSGVTCFSGVFDEWHGPEGSPEAIPSMYTLRLTTDPELLRQLHQMQAVLVVQEQRRNRLLDMRADCLRAVECLGDPNIDAAGHTPRQAHREKGSDTADSLEQSGESVSRVLQLPSGTVQHEEERNSLGKKHLELQVFLRDSRRACLEEISLLFSPSVPKASCARNGSLHSFGYPGDTPSLAHAGFLRRPFLHMSGEDQAHPVSQPLPLTARLVGLACLLEQALEASGKSLGSVYSRDGRHDKRLMDEVFAPPAETRDEDWRQGSSGWHHDAFPAQPLQREISHPCCPMEPSEGAGLACTFPEGPESAGVSGSIGYITKHAEVRRQAQGHQSHQLTSIALPRSSLRNVSATRNSTVNTDCAGGISSLTFLPASNSDKRSRSAPHGWRRNRGGKAYSSEAKYPGANEPALTSAGHNHRVESGAQAIKGRRAIESDQGRAQTAATGGCLAPDLNCRGIFCSPPSAWAIRTPFCGEFETPAAAASALIAAEGGNMQGSFTSSALLQRDRAGNYEHRMLQAVQDLLRPLQREQHKQHLLLQGRKLAIISALTTMQMDARRRGDNVDARTGRDECGCISHARGSSDSREALPLSGQTRASQCLSAASTSGSAARLSSIAYCSSSSGPALPPSVGETSLAFSLLYRGAPLNSLLADLAVAVAGLPSLQHVQRFWSSFLRSLRSAWEARKLVPRVFSAAHPVPYERACLHYCFRCCKTKAGSRCGLDARVVDGYKCCCNSRVVSGAEKRGTVSAPFESSTAEGSGKQTGDTRGLLHSENTGGKFKTESRVPSEREGQGGSDQKQGKESLSTKVPWWRFASSGSRTSHSLFSTSWGLKARGTVSSHSASTARAGCPPESGAARAFLSVSSAFFGAPSFDATLSGLQSSSRSRHPSCPSSQQARGPSQQHCSAAPSWEGGCTSPEELALAAVAAGASCVPDGPVGVPDVRGCLILQHLQQLNCAIQELRILSWKETEPAGRNRRGRSYTRTGRRQATKEERQRFEGGRHCSEVRRPSEAPFQSHRFLKWARSGDRNVADWKQQNSNAERALKVLLPGMPPVTEVTLGLHRVRLDQPEIQEGSRRESRSGGSSVSFGYLRACRAAFEAARAHQEREPQVRKGCQGQLHGEVPTFTQWWLKTLGGSLVGRAELRRLLDRQEVLLRMRQTALIEAKKAARAWSLECATLSTGATLEKETGEVPLVFRQGVATCSLSDGTAGMEHKNATRREDGASVESGRDLVGHQEDRRAQAKAVTAAVARAAAGVAREEVAAKEAAEENVGVPELVENAWEEEVEGSAEATQSSFFDAVVEGEMALHYLESISAVDLLEQLLCCFLTATVEEWTTACACSLFDADFNPESKLEPCYLEASRLLRCRYICPVQQTACIRRDGACGSLGRDADSQQRSGPSWSPCPFSSYLPCAVPALLEAVVDLQQQAVLHLALAANLSSEPQSGGGSTGPQTFSFPGTGPSIADSTAFVPSAGLFHAFLRCEVTASRAASLLQKFTRHGTGVPTSQEGALFYRNAPEKAAGLPGNPSDSRFCGGAAVRLCNRVLAEHWRHHSDATCKAVASTAPAAGRLLQGGESSQREILTDGVAELDGLGEDAEVPVDGGEETTAVMAYVRECEKRRGCFGEEEENGEDRGATRGAEEERCRPFAVEYLFEVSSGSRASSARGRSPWPLHRNSAESLMSNETAHQTRLRSAPEDASEDGVLGCDAQSSRQPNIWGGRAWADSARSTVPTVTSSSLSIKTPVEGRHPGRGVKTPISNRGSTGGGRVRGGSTTLRIPSLCQSINVKSQTGQKSPSEFSRSKVTRPRWGDTSSLVESRAVRRTGSRSRRRRGPGKYCDTQRRYFHPARLYAIERNAQCLFACGLSTPLG
ncbi:hypothetical protein CSUI_004178 [Cystoisospora suis]|uniref:Uncharacterized protein n=1 Tax=Cystoisospora suis TaxID=483139 RepID=A0A2C6KZP3_9APIC|nr:hypothetical protein CSUI_004178 [Cystoisospora suis]